MNPIRWLTRAIDNHASTQFYKFMTELERAMDEAAEEMDDEEWARLQGLEAL